MAFENKRHKTLGESKKEQPMENPRKWIHGDETAQDLLARVFIERPPLLLPPLHRVPLRAGNVVEIVGPSPSCKSEILLQAAINCILPKEWKGVHFGGLERMVMYVDLDCRFDVLRLSHGLKLRIIEACAPTHNTYPGSCEGPKKNDSMAPQAVIPFDNELFLACMKRFVYIRCYNKIEFLSALKTMRCQFQKETESLGISIYFLMIDNIGAFHWIDRACQPLPHFDNKRKVLSLQICSETVVQEISDLLQVQPLLVLATKATVFGAGISINDALRAPGKVSKDMGNLRSSRREGVKLSYRDYMPSAWQSFVTHRIHLGVSGSPLTFILKHPPTNTDQGRCPTYICEWVQPPLHILDKFTVEDNGIMMIS